MSKIHPTAIIEAGARLGEGVEVGAYAYVGPRVELGAGTRLHHHASVEGNTVLGAGCEVLAGVDAGAAGLADAVEGRFDGGVGALILGFVEERVAQEALDFGDEPLGFGEREVSHPLQCSDLITCHRWRRSA